MHQGYILHPQIPITNSMKIAELGTGTGFVFLALFSIDSLSLLMDLKKKVSGSSTQQEISLKQWSFTAMTFAMDNFLQRSFGLRMLNWDCWICWLIRLLLLSGNTTLFI
jgi:hypothetical protein